MKEIEEAIETLRWNIEYAEGRFFKDDGTAADDEFRMSLDAMKKALTLLKQQPTAGEFRQKVTCALLDSRSTEEQCTVALKLLHEAEDIIDSAESQLKIIPDLLEACIEAKIILETDPRYPGFKGCDCGRCTMCKIRVAILEAL